MKVAIVGAGAAGMFAASNIKSADITILESGGEILRKVAQSGGGRCNFTNAESDISKFIKNYPRGGRSLRKPFMRFGMPQTLQWFKERGVAHIAEGDGRIFPASQRSLQIIECLKSEAQKAGASLVKNFAVCALEKTPSGNFLISAKSGEAIYADIALLAVGGRWNESLKDSLQKLGHKFIEPLPSLFPFALGDKKFLSLAGLSLDNATLKAEEFNFETAGGLVVTHEGISGPAVLKMSSLGARAFYEKNYRFKLSLSAISSAQSFCEFCARARTKEAKKLVKNFRFPEVAERYWLFAFDRAQIPQDLDWAHFSKENQAKLLSALSDLELTVVSRAANAGEFVTCGGVDIADIDFKTMQSKKTEGLFFAGECLDIDAFTGGFNLQAAWTTAKIAALEIENICAKKI